MTSNFARLGVPASLTAALAPLGITDPTPIQAATLPDSLAGRDVLGRGRTGSGKSTTAMSILGLLPKNGEVTGGSILFNGEDIAGYSEKQLRELRGVVRVGTEVSTQVGIALRPREVRLQRGCAGWVINESPIVRVYQ
mgnify:CR=1 FL=1